MEKPDMEKLSYVFDAIGLTRKELDGRVPLIGLLAVLTHLLAI